MTTAKNFHGSKSLISAIHACGIQHSDFHYLLGRLVEFNEQSTRTQLVENHEEKQLELVFHFPTTSNIPHDGIRDLMRKMKKRVGEEITDRITYSVFAGRLKISFPLAEELQSA